MKKKYGNRGFFLAAAICVIIVQCCLPAPAEAVYNWHTFYGPGSDYAGHAVAVDGSGNIYLRGLSMATWSGPGGEPPLNAFSGTIAVFVLKLDSSGAYQWHTFYRTGTSDYGGGMAVDSSGNVFVTGYSDLNWNGPTGQSPLNAYGGGIFNIFALKLNSSGAYQWHTFYGASSWQGALAVAVDSSSNIYVTGWGQATWNGPAGVLPLHAFSGGADIFVLKLNTGGTYQWHTFYGSAGSDDEGYGISASGGNVFISGWTKATWNGPAGEAPRNAFTSTPGINNNRNIFALKLSENGVYQWHTFYPGDTGGTTVGVDSLSNVYLSGYTAVAWNGPSGQSPLHGYSGGQDLQAVKLNSSGAYQWHTFYGSGLDDQGFAVALDSGDNFYITGGSRDSWGSPIHAYGGGGDIFVLKLNPGGTYQWHTFFGSAVVTGGEWGCGIALDSSSNILLTGNSLATWNGPADEAPLNPYYTRPSFADNNTFVMKLDRVTAPVVVTSPLVDVITSISATSGGTVVSDGYGAVTVRGLCWSTLPDPVLEDSCTADGQGTGTYVSLLSGLTAGSTYHTRAYATNPAGTSYGADVSFFTLCAAGAVSDGASPYATVQLAVASGQPLVLLSSALFEEASIDIAGSGALQLKGGLNCSLDAPGGLSNIRGTLTIRESRTVTVENILLL